APGVAGARRGRPGHHAGWKAQGDARHRRAGPRSGRRGGAVELSTRYAIGQRLRHPQFGEGLVVEVHTDRGREVLEVVFDGRLVRLSAQREWQTVEAASPAALPAAAPAQPGEWHVQGEALLERWRAGTIAPVARFDLRCEAE